MQAFSSGKAAFNRIWLLTPITKSGQARQIGWRSSPPVVKTGFSRIPGGAVASVGTLGGTGTAVSIHSTHRKEAIALLRFQLRALMQAGEQPDQSGEPAPVTLSDAPSISESSSTGSNQRASIVARPSVVAGGAYKQVSRAYIDAVHSVLTGEKTGPQAAAELEKQLIEITGFRSGPPKLDARVIR